LGLFIFYLIVMAWSAELGH